MKTSGNSPNPSRSYVPAVGPKLRRLLVAMLALFALLTINAIYLAGVSLLEWIEGESYQDFFYQYMFLGHLGLGFLIIVPVVVYGCIHIANAHDRPNRRAVKAGYALFSTALILLVSGVILSLGIRLVEIRGAAIRDITYWIHVLSPLVIAWLFVLHRLAGPKINWRVGGIIATFAAVLAVIGTYVQAQDPRDWTFEGSSIRDRYFFPSLARTATGNFIPAASLMSDRYCADCHSDIHQDWTYSAHRFASFNNPAYLFSVRNTRRFAIERDGNVQASRFCAGCHDPVPLFSGAFDDPDFDDVNHPTANAGITCTVCHAISHINSPRGNADYTIDEPMQYPFANSDNAFGQWLNRFLVKAKPEFHKRTYLKPLHRTPEFCGTCHKVHLPEELNNYKWLRGQNHYDSFLLSGVSGHGASSFYYPEKAEHGCNGCHMPLKASDDFGARYFDDSLEPAIHGHQFPAANTAIPYLLKMPGWVNDSHKEFLEGSVRVDIFGLREGKSINSPLSAPIRPKIPQLQPGKVYLLEVVLRTLTLGHLFTQGTADSNEIWLDVTVKSGDRTIGRSGGLSDADGEVDPWSHFVNSYVLDRDGNRIDRRNAEDIFTALYNHQIPPGAADVVHYSFTVPESIVDPIEVEVVLNYRKFDTTYVRLFQGKDFKTNDLPITNISSDRIVFPVAPSAGSLNPEPSVPQWERWNDFGIGLLRRPGTGELRQAEGAFETVERLGRADGSLNLARVYLREGRLDDATDALARAAKHGESAYPWLIAYFSAIVNYQNGYLDEAIAGFKDVVQTRFSEAREREFDFSKDYRLLNRLALALFERAKLERGEQNRMTREGFLREAAEWYEKSLSYDPENVAAHYGLAQVYARLDEPGLAQRHRKLHAAYQVDFNARDKAVALARARDPAANHAANDVVIYELQRAGAYGLPSVVEDGS